MISDKSRTSTRDTIFPASDFIKRTVFAAAAAGADTSHIKLFFMPFTTRAGSAKSFRFVGAKPETAISGCHVVWLSYSKQTLTLTIPA